MLLDYIYPIELWKLASRKDSRVLILGGVGVMTFWFVAPQGWPPLRLPLRLLHRLLYKALLPQRLQQV